MERKLGFGLDLFLGILICSLSILLYERLGIFFLVTFGLGALYVYTAIRIIQGKPYEFRNMGPSPP